MSPASLNYRFPAEWEAHAATWLAWPHRRKTWPGKFEPIPPLYALLVRTLAKYEPVNVLAGGDAVMAEAKRLVGDVPNVTLLDMPTNDVWIRDFGPMFLVPGDDQMQAQALIDWEHNAWGRKYLPFDSDNA